MAHLMRALGFKIGHEVALQDGISAMDAVIKTDTSKMWGISYNKNTGRLIYRNKINTKLIQVVRNPWKVVESDQGHTPCVSGMVSRHFSSIISENRISQTISSIILINKMIKSLNPDLVVMVEKAPVVVEGWLRENNLFMGWNSRPPPKTIGHKNHRNLSRQDWESAEPGSIDALKKHCREYGYDDTIPG